MYGVKFGLMTLGYIFTSLMILIHRSMTDKPLGHRHEARPAVIFFDVLSGYLGLSSLVLLIGSFVAYSIAAFMQRWYLLGESHHYFLITLFIIGVLVFVIREFVVIPRRKLFMSNQEEYKKAEDEITSSAL